MLTTTYTEDNQTQTQGAEPQVGNSAELLDRYNRLVHSDRLQWTTYQRLEKLLGSGGQGIVFLSHRRGADEFTLPLP